MEGPTEPPNATHTPYRKHCNRNDLIYYSLIFYDIQFAHTNTRTHAETSRKVIWHSIKMCSCGSFQLSRHHQQTISLSLSILVPSSHFLSSRNSLRIVGKIFPNRHRNNNLYNYLLIAIKQKYNKKRALK